MFFTDLKLRWLIYTVLFGMVPIFLRLLVSVLVTAGQGVSYLTASDFISFGIVLQVSIFNEIKYHDLSDAEWKHRMMGVSAFLMIPYACLYVLLLMSEAYAGVNMTALLYFSMSSAGVSFLLCFCFYDRMSKISSLTQGG